VPHPNLQSLFAELTTPAQQAKAGAARKGLLG
jgi:hypothetical protein